MNPYACTSAGCELAKNGGLVSLPLVTVAGLVDSLNPCAIGIIILLLTSLIIFAKKPQRVLPTGLLYIFAVFLTYLALGLIFYQSFTKINIAPFRFYFNKTLGSLLFLAGVINLKDFVFPQIGPHLEVPDFGKRYLQKMARTVSYPMAFILGILVTILGTPCSLPIYVGTVHILSRSGLGILGILGYFIYYNFLFILPLLIILLLVWKGNEWKLIEFQDLEHRGKRWMRLALGILLLGMGIWLVR